MGAVNMSKRSHRDMARMIAEAEKSIQPELRTHAAELSGSELIEALRRSMPLFIDLGFDYYAACMLEAAARIEWKEGEQSK